MTILIAAKCSDGVLLSTDMRRILSEKFSIFNDAEICSYMNPHQVMIGLAGDSHHAIDFISTISVQLEGCRTAGNAARFLAHSLNKCVKTPNTQFAICGIDLGAPAIFVVERNKSNVWIAVGVSSNIVVMGAPPIIFDKIKIGHPSSVGQLANIVARFMSQAASWTFSVSPTFRMWTCSTTGTTKKEVYNVRYFRKQDDTNLILVRREQLFEI